MQTNANMIGVSAVLLMVALLTTASYAASPRLSEVPGNSVAIPPGSQVTVNGNTARISGAEGGDFYCRCRGKIGGYGCAVVQTPNSLTCGKIKGMNACKSGCVLETTPNYRPAVSRIPSTSLTPVKPGGTTGLNTGVNPARTAPVTR